MFSRHLIGMLVRKHHNWRAVWLAKILNLKAARRLCMNFAHKKCHSRSAPPWNISFVPWFYWSTHSAEQSCSPEEKLLHIYNVYTTKRMRWLGVYSNHSKYYQSYSRYWYDRYLLFSSSHTLTLSGHPWIEYEDLNEDKRLIQISSVTHVTDYKCQS